MTVAQAFWVAVLPRIFFPLLADSWLTDGTTDSTASATGLIATPLLLIVRLACLSLYTQTLLVLFRSRRKKIAATFRTICYADSAALVQIVPIIGPALSLVLWVYLIITGIHIVHGISRTRTVLVLLLPAVVFMVIVICIMAAMFAASEFLNASPADLFSLLTRH